MKVYIAGPMRGIPDYNFPAFDAASEKWKAAGHTPFSPAAVDRACHVDSSAELTEALCRRVIMLDITLILHSDAIALLPGWENSSGVAVELALAQFLKLPIYDAITMEQIYPAVVPWSLIEERYCVA